MIDAASLAAQAVVVGIAVVAGYAIGSIPTGRLIAARAGVDPLAAGERIPGSANVWKLAGPGWGLLALAADLAKGVIPVALGIVSWSWSVGWVAGLGALTGACWPALGRFRGGRGVATLGGVAFTLAPAAGTVSVLLTLAVVAAGALVGRNARVAATATGIGTFPPLFLAWHQDVVRLAALLVLYLVALVRYATTRGRRRGIERP